MRAVLYKFTPRKIPSRVEKEISSILLNERKMFLPFYPVVRYFSLFQPQKSCYGAFFVEKYEGKKAPTLALGLPE